MFLIMHCSLLDISVFP